MNGEEWLAFLDQIARLHMQSDPGRRALRCASEFGSARKQAVVKGGYPSCARGEEFARLERPPWLFEAALCFADSKKFAFCAPLDQQLRSLMKSIGTRYAAQFENAGSQRQRASFEILRRVVAVGEDRKDIMCLQGRPDPASNWLGPVGLDCRDVQSALPRHVLEEPRKRIGVPCAPNLRGRSYW